MADRAKKVAENEAKGLRMLHDNFDHGWERGQEPHGTMIFTDIMPPGPEPPPDYKALYAAAINDRAKLEVIAKSLGLK